MGFTDLRATCIPVILVYRLPMYEVIEFLWTLPAYKDCITKLSDEVSLLHIMYA